MRRGKKLLLATVALAVTALTVFCARESPERRAATDYASKVDVQGFRHTHTSNNPEGVTRTFVGPRSIDLAAAVTAPGFTFSSSRPGSEPTSNALYTYIAKAKDIKVGDMSCALSIAHLKVGGPAVRDESDAAADGDWLNTLGLTEAEISAVAHGDAIVLEIYTVCHSAM
ncbi:hypothetical protein SAMN05444365_105104 [Micromonospora pattaloongensis]|uniref:CHRD domain-containing protein n=1 Tax=Micromonospora pattaloongensis TaxID=405436 RepID=A0A1H3PYA6_9ACTN|nr:hypothetical protein [Micromonospora pattaloongensis]SDZ05990.1 hypothetical protein SAMN05444365_105104 [Micromonospora pattaloongensis]